MRLSITTPALRSPSFSLEVRDGDALICAFTYSEKGAECSKPVYRFLALLSTSGAVDIEADDLTQRLYGIPTTLQFRGGHTVVFNRLTVEGGVYYQVAEVVLQKVTPMCPPFIKGSAAIHAKASGETRDNIKSVETLLDYLAKHHVIDLEKNFL